MLVLLFFCFSFSLGFDRVNRTLCYNNMTGADSRLAYVDVFTSFRESVSFNIVFDPVFNYAFQYECLYSCVCVFTVCVQ